MKKLFVLLLALCVVGGAFAQAKVAIAASGSMNLLKDTSATLDKPQASNAPDGAGYETLTFSANGADDKFGVEVSLANFMSGAAQDIASNDWNIFYQYDWGKVEFGTAGYGYTSDLNVSITSNYDRDGFGEGLYYSSPAIGGLTFNAFLPITQTATDSITVVKNAGLAAKYVVEKTLKVEACLALGLAASTMVADAYVDFTGVENLDAYGFAEYTQATKNVDGGVGASYKLGAATVIGEFEARLPNGASMIWDAAARVNYTINDKLSARGQFVYNSAKAYAAKGYVYYALGNGLKANQMLGYDSAAKFIYQTYLGYSISL